MSVVIIGGNECMVRQYKDLCRKYQCDAKVIPKKQSSLKGLGNPDLQVLFTGTVSHKLMRNALNEIKGSDIRITRSHTSSMSACSPTVFKYAASGVFLPKFAGFIS